MHDTVWFEINGIPAVGVISREFESAAVTQASALGLPEAKCAYVAHPIQDANDEEIVAKCNEVWDAIVDALTRA